MRCVAGMWKWFGCCLRQAPILRSQISPTVPGRSCCRLLLSRGATQELGVAAHLGDSEFVRDFLDKDPAAAGRFSASRWSPLRHAARGGQIEVVRLLLKHGADPNLAEHCADRGAALYEACCRQDLETAKLLIEHGAYVDSSGVCLSNVAESSIELIDLLTAYGAQC